MGLKVQPSVVITTLSDCLISFTTPAFNGFFRKIMSVWDCVLLFSSLHYTSEAIAIDNRKRNHAVDDKIAESIEFVIDIELCSFCFNADVIVICEGPALDADGVIDLVFVHLVPAWLEHGVALYGRSCW